MGHYCDSTQRESLPFQTFQNYFSSTDSQIISPEIKEAPAPINTATVQKRQHAPASSMLEKLFTCAPSNRHGAFEDGDEMVNGVQELETLFNGDNKAMKEVNWLFTKEELCSPIDIKSQKFQGFKKHFKKQFKDEEEYMHEMRKLQSKPTMIAPFIIKYQKWAI